MKKEALARQLRFILVGMGLCGLAVYGWFIPSAGRGLAAGYPEFSGFYWPWLLFLWATGVPCLIALVPGWKIADSIGKDRSFTQANARRLALIANLAAGDAAFFFIGNVALWLLNMNFPGVVLMSLMVVFVGAAITVAAACLSHLVQKAAALQEQSDLTI